MFGLRPPFVHFVVIFGSPAQCRAEDSIVHRLGGWVALRPRGPRSGPSYAVSDRHHLIDPIRSLGACTTSLMCNVPQRYF
jgi:hypothetical protein